MTEHHTRTTSLVALAAMLTCAALAWAAPARAQSGAPWARHVVAGVSFRLPPSHPTPARVDAIGAVSYYRGGHIAVSVIESTADLREIVEEMDAQGGTTTSVTDLQIGGDEARFVYRSDGSYFHVRLKRVGDRVLSVLTQDEPPQRRAAERIVRSAERAEG